MRYDTMLAIGAALFIAGVALLSVPAALIAAGLLVCVAAALMAAVAGRSKT